VSAMRSNILAVLATVLTLFAAGSIVVALVICFNRSIELPIRLVVVLCSIGVIIAALDVWGRVRRARKRGSDRG
jgi:uncharacterized protein (DUF983 family)